MAVSLAFAAVKASLTTHRSGYAKIHANVSDFAVVASLAQNSFKSQAFPGLRPY
jgi:hypothetical protein